MAEQNEQMGRIETASIRILKDDKDFIEKLAKENGKHQYWIIHEALKFYKEKNDE